jgi:hypothetical protein
MVSPAGEILGCKAPKARLARASRRLAGLDADAGAFVSWTKATNAKNSSIPRPPAIQGRLTGLSLSLMAPLKVKQ